MYFYTLKLFLKGDIVRNLFFFRGGLYISFSLYFSFADLSSAVANELKTYEGPLHRSQALSVAEVRATRPSTAEK